MLNKEQHNQLLSYSMQRAKRLDCLNIILVSECANRIMLRHRVEYA